jgi:hypothetical protein
MNTKNIFKISLGVFVLFSLIIGVKAQAVTTPTTSTVPTKGIILAEVNIQDIKIISQDNNNLKISFNLSNGKGVQSGVKYGIKLLKQTSNNQFVVDEKVYDESLTLAENSIISREINYTAPNNLSGEYNVLIVSRNETGFPFGIASAGKIKLTSTFKGISIMPETCYLTVVDEKGSPKYNLLQGVDISQKESLKLNCSVTNSDIKTIEVTPIFETHYRTAYGQVVPQTEVENKPITFTKGEKKNISLLLPKATEPQAYDVVTTLKSGENVSNSITAHYVLQGASATIQNLSLDKDYYKKGETATLSFSWTPSADSFPGSRIGKASAISDITLSGTITSGKGHECSSPIDQPITKDQSIKTEIPISIVSRCLDPQISLALKDKDGKILDQKDFSVKTTTKEKPISTILIVVIVLAIIILIIAIRKLKKNPPANPTKNIPVGILFLFLSVITVGSLIPMNKVRADTAYQGGATTTVYNISKTTNVSPGESINAEATMEFLGCGNAEVLGYVGAHNSVTHSQGGTYSTLIDTSRWNHEYVYGVAGVNAPDSAGSYSMVFRIKSGIETYSYDELYMKDFTVVAATVDMEIRKVGGSWGKSTNVSVGDYVEVRWTPQNATYCSCTYDNGPTGNCGTGVSSGFPIYSNPQQFYITKPLSFNVHCDP